MLFPIRTNHHDALLPSLDEGVQQRFHALVKEGIPLDRTILLVEAFKLRDWKVPEENCCMF